MSCPAWPACPFSLVRRNKSNWIELKISTTCFIILDLNQNLYKICNHIKWFTQIIQTLINWKHWFIKIIIIVLPIAKLIWASCQSEKQIVKLQRKLKLYSIQRPKIRAWLSVTFRPYRHKSTRKPLFSKKNWFFLVIALFATVNRHITEIVQLFACGVLCSLDRVWYEASLLDSVIASVIGVAFNYLGYWIIEKELLLSLLNFSDYISTNKAYSFYYFT